MILNSTLNEFIGIRNMQIPDVIRKSVAFICYKNETNVIIPVGTCFLTTVHIEGIDFYYFVTAKHVLGNIILKNPNATILIRANKNQDKGFDYIETSYEDWIHHQDDNISVDVSVLPVPYINLDIFDVKGIPFDMMVNDQTISKMDVNIGNEIFMVGLFSLHYGKNNNIPIVRVGNISAMPDEPIKTKEFGDMQAYLVDLRSLGGFSGSPVFIHFGTVRIINGELMSSNFPQFRLIGLLSGHFTINGITIDDFRTNTGMGIVTPSTKILETLMQTNIELIRKERLILEENKRLDTFTIL